MSNLKEYLKQKFYQTRLGNILKKSLESNNIDDEWSNIIMSDPLNEEKVYEIGKKYENNFFPNGLKNSPFPNKSPDNKENLFKEQHSERSKEYMNSFTQNYRPELDILLNPIQNLDSDDILKAKKFAMFDNDDVSLGKQINDKISSWYNNIYGTAPVKRDATGRQITTNTKLSSQHKKPLLAKDGNTIENSLQNLSEQLTLIDNNSSNDGVKALQKSLNILGAIPPLDIDGKLGPKTTFQTRKYLVENGYEPLAKSIKTSV